MSIVERWRRWRRARALKARRWCGGEFGPLVAFMREDLATMRRSTWRLKLRMERAAAAELRAKRMRGGIDVPGLP